MSLEVVAGKFFTSIYTISLSFGVISFSWSHKMYYVTHFHPSSWWFCLKDIKEGMRKQKQDKEALQRFNEKWKLFKPQHQDQEKDDERETEDNGNHETRSDDLDQSDESKERIEDGSGVTRVTDTESSQSTKDDTITTEEEQEQADDGQNNTYTKNNVGRERVKRN